MGEIADSMINGEFDYITGEYLGDPVGYPRTFTNKSKLSPAEKEIKRIRKELTILIKENIKNNIQNPVNDARKSINLKYGRGWRENGLIKK